MSFDQIGHLAYKPDGTVHDGLCHCARERAHYADEEAPQGPMRPTREQMERVTRRVVDYYTRGGDPS